MAAPAPGPLGLVEEDDVVEEGGLLDGLDDEDRLLGAEEPVFHAPVVFSHPGVTSDARAFSQRLAGLRSAGLGEVVCGITAGSRGATQRVDLSEPSGSVGHHVPIGDAGAHCDSEECPPGEPRRPGPPGRRRPLMTDDAADLADDAGGLQNDDGAPALVPRAPVVAWRQLLDVLLVLAVRTPLRTQWRSRLRRACDGPAGSRRVPLLDALRRRFERRLSWTRARGPAPLPCGLVASSVTPSCGCPAVVD